MANILFVPASKFQKNTNMKDNRESKLYRVWQS